MPKQSDPSDRDDKLPDFIERGTRARLFPSVADSNRERRLTSVFLAILPQMRDLAEDLLATTGVKVGKSTKIDCWTEVEPKKTLVKDKAIRPDGLIVLRIGRKTIWTALVEAKIKENAIEKEQVEKYLRMAQSCNIDAVVTISNQFVARADHSPVAIDGRLLRGKVRLYHWSWTYIRTRCEILSRDAIQDAEQAFMLKQFVLFLGDKDTGVKRFNSMGESWKKIIETVGPLRKDSPEVLDCVGSWHQEERDLSLQLSRVVATAVRAIVSPKFKNDPNKRLKDGAERFAKDKKLFSAFDIPNSAAPLEICADLASRRLIFSMKLKAPVDKGTQGHIGWLLRMLKSDKDDERQLLVRAHWPGRAPSTQALVSELRENWKDIQGSNSNSKVKPHSFEVILAEDLGRSFSGPQKFIQHLEEGSEKFYNLAGRRLKKWSPSPLQPVTSENLSQNTQASPESNDTNPRIP